MDIEHSSQATGLAEVGFLREKDMTTNTENIVGVMVILDEIRGDLAELTGQDVEYDWEVQVYTDSTIEILVAFKRFGSEMRPFRFLFDLKQQNHLSWLRSLCTTSGFWIVNRNNTNILVNPFVSLNVRSVVTALEKMGQRFDND